MVAASLAIALFWLAVAFQGEGTGLTGHNLNTLGKTWKCMWLHAIEAKVGRDCGRKIARTLDKEK